MTRDVRTSAAVVWLVTGLLLLPTTAWAANFSGPFVFGLLLAIPIAIPVGSAIYFLVVKRFARRPGLKPWAGTVTFTALVIVMEVTQSCDPDSLRDPPAVVAPSQDAGAAP